MSTKNNNIKLNREIDRKSNINFFCSFKNFVTIDEKELSGL